MFVGLKGRENSLMTTIKLASGVDVPAPNFSEFAVKVLEDGNILGPAETPTDMMARVFNSVFMAEHKFGTARREIARLQRDFADYVAAKQVILGSPLLTNAGRYLDRALSSCVAVPIDLRQSFDKVTTLIEAYYEQNMGSGFDLSSVRDPVAMMELLNRHAAEQSNTGRYDRYIGNMANLDVDHPEVAEFIRAKVGRPDLCHFNISVNASDQFMNAVETARPFVLRDGTAVSATDMWSDLITSAWQCGDPGLLFLDRFNAHNPTPLLGTYVTTAPCAEVGLSPGEACVFGYINIGQFVSAEADGRLAINFTHLERVVTVLTRVLDDALEVSLDKYPSSISRTIMSAKRKVGIGICGLADLFFKLRIAYDSAEAIRLTQNILVTINYVSKCAAVDLAEVRGSFTAFPMSRYVTDPGFLAEHFGSLRGLRVSGHDWEKLDLTIKATGYLRNASTTALPPSGRSALVLDASTSLEPWFSLYTDSGKVREDVHAYVQEWCGRETLASDVFRAIANYGTCQLPALENTPIASVVKTATEVRPEAHLHLVAAASQCVDEGASKTVVLPGDCPPGLVSEVFMMAWQLGLKAISVYRDGSSIVKPNSRLTVSPVGE